MSGGPTPSGVRSVNACSIVVVHVVADQEHSDRVVPQYRYGIEFGMEICNADCASVNQYL